MYDNSAVDFAAVLAVQSLFSGLSVPWWIGGGWAIDLAIGEASREHGDIDVVLLERDEHALHTDLPDLSFGVIETDRTRPWGWGERLLAGPSRLLVEAPELPQRTEILFAGAVGTNWVFHRGSHGIARSLKLVTKERYGIRYLAPEVVLLLKCLSDRAKDGQDFDVALSILGDEQRQWLREGVGRRWFAACLRAGVPQDTVGPHPWELRLGAA